MRRFDFTDPEMERGSAPEGVDDLEALIHIGKHLRGSLYEVAPGLRGYPYHWEAAKEEWLLVLEGTPTIRHPEGQTELRRGDLVAFPANASGAHQVLNHSQERVRFIMFSNMDEPNVIVYPDSRKVGIRGDLGLPGSANYSLDATLDYWEGER